MLVFGAVFLVLVRLCGVFCATLLYESPGGNQVDGLPPAQSNARGERNWLLRLKLCMASRVFKCDVREILTSDLDKNANRASLGSTERSRVNAMSIIIMSAEI